MRVPPRSADASLAAFSPARASEGANRPSAGVLAALELSLFAAGYWFCFWRAPGRIDPSLLFPLTVALIVFPFVLNALRGLRLAEVGYDFTRFGEGMSAAVVLVAPLLAAVPFMGRGHPLVTAALLGVVRLHLSSPALTVAAWLLFALLQQSILMGFVFHRLRRLSGSPSVSVAGTAALFALSHWPNLPLFAITLCGGLVFGCLFLRCRNVIPLACLHGAATLFIFSFLSGAVAFSVGRAYAAGAHFPNSERNSVEFRAPGVPLTAVARKGVFP